ncbi:cell wall metabolism sensor histidine kinase WalK [Lyngbya sp. PCC 8106]|uniref:sensor histidine kinase n=1 Tax=Lyngbya sp. (strain PCC 8106) TaxID=313612 RepID=UPI0000EAB69F|nr:HAMP domain-containing sensor histidine kinase [Lyngbya sp. PCC 8106]EAW34469.1 two-component sensor histidine kinase [Lyngbya sp. PCC 8106]
MKSLTIKSLTTKRVKANPFFQVRRIFWETRTYIFLWYLVVMAVFIGLSVPIFSILIWRQVNTRVEEELVEELKAFDTLIDEQKITEEGLTQENLPKFFKHFLSVRIPEDDTFLITILDGKFFRSSPRALPETVWQNSELMGYFLQLNKSERNRYKTSDPNIGDIMYLTRPVIAEGQIRGLFVVLHTTAGERQEIIESEIIVIKVLFIVLFWALILAWIASGKILAPLRSLSTTALAISESDLSQRIPIKGTGEMAEVAMTFNKMMDRLEAAFTSQQALINDASHELRTPITIIDCHLEQLTTDSQEQKKIVKLLKDELNRMNRLVNDLLLLAKAERPDFLNCEIVEIGSLTEELYTKATTLAKRNWCLEVKGTGRIIADPQRLTQAFLNLAHNATKYTSEDDVITVGATISKGKFSLWVRDTGEGIDTAHQKKIFERFERDVNGRRSEGLGLGLAIVKAIASAHQGWVELESQVGIGATFTIVIPV